MAKTKVKVVVKTGRKGDAGTLVARVPVAVVKNAKPQGKPIYQTKAQMNIHIRSGQRTTEFRYRGTR